MELALFFRVIKELANRLANKLRQGQAMSVSHLLQAFRLFDRDRYRRSRSHHVSSVRIKLQHLTCVWMERRIYGDIRNDRPPSGRYSADY
jgi:hypothetical protein